MSRLVRLTNLLVRTSEARRLGQLSSLAFFLEARSVLSSHRHTTPLSLCFSGCDFCFCFNVLVNSSTALPGLEELDHCLFFYGSLNFCEILLYLVCLVRFCFSLSRITYILVRVFLAVLCGFSISLGL